MKKLHKVLWKRTMVAEGKAIYAKFKRGQRAGWRTFKGGFLATETAYILGHRLDVLLKGRRLLWLLDGGRAGVGFLQKVSAQEWEVVGAAIVSARRGRGIYPTILRTLRQWGELPIVSGQSMTSAAIRAWKKVGELSKASGRYRLNPGRRS